MKGRKKKKPTQKRGVGNNGCAHAKKGARKGYAKPKEKKIVMYMCLYSCTPHQGPGLAPQLVLTSIPITFVLQVVFLVLINILSLGALSERS